MSAILVLITPHPAHTHTGRCAAQHPHATPPASGPASAPPCHTSCIRSHAPMPPCHTSCIRSLPALPVYCSLLTSQKQNTGEGGGRGASVLSACQLAGQHVKQIALSAVMRSRECTRRAPPHPTHHSVCLLVNAPHHHGVLLPTPPTILSACSC